MRRKKSVNHDEAVRMRAVDLHIAQSIYRRHPELVKADAVPASYAQAYKAEHGTSIGDQPYLDELHEADYEQRIRRFVLNLIAVSGDTTPAG